MKVPTLFKNKYVLYVLLLVGVINVLGYIALEQYNALALFVVLGLLSSYFSKNMSVNLLVAIAGTSLMVINNKVQEGFEEGHDNVQKGLKPQNVTRTPGQHPQGSQSEQQVSDQGGSQQSDVGRLQKLKNAISGDRPSGGQGKTGSQAQAQQQQAQPQQGGGGGVPLQQQFAGCAKGTSCPKGKVCNSQSDCVVGFRNNVPPSTPAAVDEDEDATVGDRIDYAATMEQAYDNLQKMLGEGGMKGITAETKKLVTQQKDLMNTLNSMAPVLTQAKEALAGMDLPNMGELSGFLKKINNGGLKPRQK